MTNDGLTPCSQKHVVLLGATPTICPTTYMGWAGVGYMGWGGVGWGTDHVHVDLVTLLLLRNTLGWGWGGVR